MDEHSEQLTPPEAPVSAPETEYFVSPLDLTPEEIEREKGEVNGELEEYKESGHYWNHVISRRFADKLLTDPETFDANFKLNENEQQFIRQTVLDEGNASIDHIEAMPSLRDQMDLSEDAFKNRLARLKSGDYEKPYELSQLCVLFENKYQVPEETWRKAVEGNEEGTSVITASHLKLIDPERFKRDDIASRVEYNQSSGYIPSIEMRAAIKIIQADGIKYDREHGMQLVTTKKAA